MYKIFKLGHHAASLFFAASVIMHVTVQARAEETVLIPLRIYAEQYSASDRKSVRLILDRCAALYIFATSRVNFKQSPQYAQYENKATLFLAAARSAAVPGDITSVPIMHLSSAYHRYSDENPGSEQPFSQPLIQSDLAFCDSYSSKLSGSIRKTAS